LQLHASIQLLVAWGELLGGIALLLGILTRWAALGLIIIQIGAIYMVTWAQGFSSLQGGGYGYNVALIAMLLALVLLGGGAYAVDRLLPWGRKAAAREPATMAAV
jgi:putative oxidoreductase